MQRAIPGWAVAVLGAGALGGYVGLAHHLPSPGRGDAAIILQGVAGLALTLAAALLVAHAMRGAPRLAVAGAVLGGSGVAVGLARDLEWVATPGRLLVAAAAGVALAAAVGGARQLLVLAVLTGVADAVSVAAGPTGYADAHARGFLRAAGLRLPGWGGPPHGLLGAVDVMFAVVFVIAAHRARWHPRAVTLAVGAGMALALVVAVRLDRPVPAITAAAIGVLMVAGVRPPRTGNG